MESVIVEKSNQGMKTMKLKLVNYPNTQTVENVQEQGIEDHEYRSKDY